jgi:hypothetical protein
MSNQTTQNGNRVESKLPPVGNFSVAASASKENKKRPRNSNVAASSSIINTPGESSRIVGSGGTVNKVRS